MKIGLIGGSGIYTFIEDPKKVDIPTPFGSVSFEVGNVGDHTVYFIPRHGKSHSIPPNKINYRANIFAAHLSKLEMVLATNAVGSMKENIKIGDFVILDQVLDKTNGRPMSFFEGQELKVKLNTGEQLEGVVHTDVSNPFCHSVRQRLISSCKKLKQRFHDHGTIVVTNGPRFETPAEINAYRILGASVVGMTTAPEVFLANEVRLPYASLAIVSNYAAGMQDAVSASEVFDLFNKRLENIKHVILASITN